MGAEAIAPLLMMATVAGLQAEAASALTDLLASSCVDTVYPAARCVSDLAAFGRRIPSYVIVGCFSRLLLGQLLSSGMQKASWAQHWHRLWSMPSDVVQDGSLPLWQGSFSRFWMMQ